MSRVLIASITELCHADHADDPNRIAEWTSNKTPDGILAMLARDGFFMVVAEVEGQVVAVGATTADGEIALNYVAPDMRFRGISTRLLEHMEADLAGRGFGEGRLKATRTALPFYRARGWTSGEVAQSGRFIDCFVMRKTLA
ncbi:GNAT family N-acetyltransferase [Devosia sp. CAU 1758]